MLKIGNNKITGFYEYSEFPKSLNYDIDFNFKNDKIYTEIIFDPDTNNGNYIHLLRVNNNDIIFLYISPNPPNGIHRYYVLIYEQENIINNTNIKNRSFFDIDNFVKKNKLHEVSSNMFKVSKN